MTAPEPAPAAVPHDDRPAPPLPDAPAPPPQIGAPALEPPGEAPPVIVRTIGFRFHGSGGEYFRIWIVNVLLTVLTLGIYSAWAKVRRQRYFLGNTDLDGSRFDYHGQPMAILKGRVLAVMAYLAFTVSGNISPVLALVMLTLLMVALPWILIRARMFQMFMTSWRGLRFGFRATYRQAFVAELVWPLLGMATLGLLLPYGIWKAARFQASSSAYGSQPFHFTGGAWAFYRALLEGLALLALSVGLVVVILTAGGVSLADASYVDTYTDRIIAAVLIGMATSLMALTHIQAHLTNALLSGIMIGPHRLVSSLRTLPLLTIGVSNLLLMVLTLGLFYPWARVRALRYQLDHLHVQAQGDLAAFTAAAGPTTGPFGEAVGDVFDLDLDFGF